MEIRTVTIETKAVKQGFPMVLPVTLNKVLLTFEPVNEVRIKCDHSSESY